jgi:hypothetical protein
MMVPARREPAPDALQLQFEDDDAQERPFYAGERICAPRDRRGGSALPALLLILLIAGSGWALMAHPDVWQRWLPAGLAGPSAPMDARAPPVEPALAPLEPTHPAEPPSPAGAVPVPQVQAASEPAPAGDAPAPAEQAVTTIVTASIDKAPAAEPLPPPVVDPGDPYQRRAAAVGLHPELSRALLARLSATDYRNAGTAIDRALAKTPDTGTFVWPRQRRPELALFEVHFVPGAAPNCRRYVVTVTKDRWSTTAPPMERCGAHLADRGK